MSLMAQGQPRKVDAPSLRVKDNATETSTNSVFGGKGAAGKSNPTTATTSLSTPPAGLHSGHRIPHPRQHVGLSPAEFVAGCRAITLLVTNVCPKVLPATARVIEAVAGAPVPIHASLTTGDVTALDAGPGGGLDAGGLDADGLDDTTGERLWMTDDDAKQCTFRPRLSAVARKYENGGQLVKRMSGDVKHRLEQVGTLLERPSGLFLWPVPRHPRTETSRITLDLSCPSSALAATLADGPRQL